MTRCVWKTRLGFYLAAIGSAFGLGSLWRFPYVVAENGGGAFVLLYIFLIFFIGTPLLIGELMLGKVMKKSLMAAAHQLEGRQASQGSVKKESHKRLSWVSCAGHLPVIMSILALSYYAVISGWVLHFFMQFAVSQFVGEGMDAARALKVLQENGWLQIMLTSVHLLLVGLIVAKDVEEGLERAMGYTMPAFVVLLLVLIFKALSLDSSEEALRFFLYPDFSKLGFSAMASAVGHVFFTLSLGFGTMVTFGSYLQDKAYIPLAGFRVAILDSAISLFAGVLIFPLVLASSTQESGINLLFETVPFLLTRIQGGQIYGIGFFLCLYLASLGASIGLLETIVTNFRDRYKVKRGRGTVGVSLLCFVLAIVPALSSTLFKAFQINGNSILALLDTVVVNWVLPISGLLLSQIVVRRLEAESKAKEFVDDQRLSSAQFFGHWRFILKYIIPAVVILALGLEIIGVVLG